MRTCEYSVRSPVGTWPPNHNISPSLPQICASVDILTQSGIAQIIEMCAAHRISRFHFNLEFSVHVGCNCDEFTKLLELLGCWLQ